MSLIVETGSGVSNAESLCDVAFATQYHADRNNTAWSALTTAQMETALRKATDYMEAVYKSQWQGMRVNNIQALDWPRVGVTANNYYVLSTIVPLPIKKACCELALKTITIDLLPDTTQQKTSVTVGPISTTYDKFSPQNKQFPAIKFLLQPYFDVASGFTHRLIR